MLILSQLNPKKSMILPNPIISILMKLLLNPQPKMNFSPGEVVAYDELIPKVLDDQLLSTDIPFP